MINRLVIEVLSLEKGKAYGFQEYIFNLLDYMYENRKCIRCRNIVIICKSESAVLFNAYKDVFSIVGYRYKSYLKRYWLETIFPIWLGLGDHDLLFSPGNYSGWIKVCPEILVVHDLLFKRKQWIPSKLMRLQRELYFPRSIKKANKIIAISQFTKKDIEHFYPEAIGKVDVIYNAMNFNKFVGDNSINVGFDYFIVISSNENYKNQRTILKAFQLYCEDGGKLDLIIIGRFKPDSEAGIVYSNLSNIIKNRIHWKHDITNTELGALYNKASCFISASKFEGLGMPVVEAMSFGLPAILSDIAPHHEISMGKAVFFDANNPKDLASKMSKMDFSKREYANAIKGLFSEENTSDKYIQLINEFAD